MLLKRTALVFVVYAQPRKYRLPHNCGFGLQFRTRGCR
jgi:hypothetical protein